MFTGIVEELGIVTSLIQSSNQAKLTLSVENIKAKAGESIAVNGVCLTVVNLRRNFIEFDVSAESFKRTALLDLKVGEKVNLERALAVSGRLGGHLVTGHADGVGEVKNKIYRGLGKGFELHLSLPSELLRYLVLRGSITLDGVSLTIGDLRSGLLVVSIIPHTASSTTLGQKNIGDRVNVEVDILSKYIERHLKGEVMGGITHDTLTRVGFFPMGWIDN